MLSTDQSPRSRLPELPYGSVWLIGDEGSDLRHLSPLVVHALSTADTVIHDPGIVREILDLVKPPRYREAASPGRAIERAVEGALRCAERNIPFRIVPGAGDPVGNDAPLGLLLVRKTLSAGGADTRPTFVVLITASQSDAAAENAPLTATSAVKKLSPAMMPALTI